MSRQPVSGQVKRQSAYVDDRFAGCYTLLSDGRLCDQRPSVGLSSKGHAQLACVLHQVERAEAPYLVLDRLGQHQGTSTVAATPRPHDKREFIHAQVEMHRNRVMEVLPHYV